MDDVRPFGQLADWTPEETDGDSQDDALRLMDGSEIASVKECLGAGKRATGTKQLSYGFNVTQTKDKRVKSYLLSAPTCRCVRPRLGRCFAIRTAKIESKNEPGFATLVQLHPFLVFTSDAA